MCIEMDASVLIQQQMPCRRFEKETRTEKTILSLNVKDIFCTSSLLWNYIIIIIVVVVVIVFTGYGGFAVVNTTVVVVEKNIPVLFKIEFYYIF